MKHELIIHDTLDDNFDNGEFDPGSIMLLR